MRFLTRLRRNEKGASAVEYGLIVSLIVVAMIAALTRFATTTTNMWNFVEEEVTSV